jgi:hypothetical protein
MLAHPQHVFLPDHVSIANRQFVAVDKLVGHRQVTDAHLLGVALMSGAQLVTLDRSIVSLVPAGFDQGQAVTVIV